MRQLSCTTCMLPFCTPYSALLAMQPRTVNHSPTVYRHAAASGHSTAGASEAARVRRQDAEEQSGYITVATKEHSGMRGLL